MSENITEEQGLKAGVVGLEFAMTSLALNLMVLELLVDKGLLDEKEAVIRIDQTKRMIMDSILHTKPPLQVTENALEKVDQLGDIVIAYARTAAERNSSSG